ncbi:hypothetical protein TPB0596_22490 [Tsukamurella pulmonis]|nr:hypothetical protein TPB0596_22490 [Tsukamurella pulmonis]
MGAATTLSDLPGDLIPPGLVAAMGRERVIAEVLFEQRRSEGLAYCRTMTSLYALYRAMYADDEAEYLARPAGFAEAVEARRRLSAAGVAVEAQVSTLLRLGPTAARLAIETAIGFVERLPRVFALIGENVISPKAGEAALRRSQALDDVLVRRFDELLADRLTVDYEVLSLPALREAADVIVEQIDAEAAERRRRAALEERRVAFRPEQDGMAAVFALLPAEDALEVEARVEQIAGTVCDADPRTLPQRRADGWVQLTRGYGTLGCRCETSGCRYREARFHGEPDADGVITRFVTLINVVINERDLASPGAPSPDDARPVVASGTELGRRTAADAPTATAAQGDASHGQHRLGYLVGHGVISLDRARELAAREGARIRPFGQRIDERVNSHAADRDPLRGSQEPAGIGDDPRGRLDFAAVWADIVVRLEGHNGPGDGWGFDDGPPDGDPPEADPPDGPPDPDDDPDQPRDPSPRGGASGTERPDGPENTGRVHGPIVTARGSSRYRPSADLRRYLRMVHPRCVFPYCTRPAARAQLDHRREFDHRAPREGGGTSADQLQPLCVAHHQLKTAVAWIDARMPDGRILWTSPDGRRYLVDPSSTVLALFPDLERVRWIVPKAAVSAASTNPGSRPGGRTRLQREHARRELLRRRNVAAMQAELDRASTTVSTIEENLASVIGAPRPTRVVAPFDGPPPF